MANPQLENGHLKIANEIWDHLMSIGLSGTEHDLVMMVIRRTWGWNKKTSEISLAEFLQATHKPERTGASALKTLVAKNVLICTKGGGRGVRSSWQLNKDWESWKTLPSIAEKKHATINSAKINTVLNGSQTLPSIAEFTAENGRVSSCKLLPGLEQLAPKDILKDNKDILHTLFERFYAVYPKKKGKASAVKAFLKIKPTEDLLEKMFQALEWQTKEPDWIKEKGQFIPYPATWLNGRRWEDQNPAEKEATKPKDFYDEFHYETLPGGKTIAVRNK